MISFKKVIRSMTALFVGMSFLFVAHAVMVSSLGVILKQNNTPEWIIGLIGSCFSIGGILSTFSSHRLVSRIGHIRSFGILCAGFSICVMMHNLINNLYFWGFLRFVIGFCYYGLLMVIESWLNTKARDSIRSRVLSFYEIVFYSSYGMGVLIIALNLDYQTLFIISACLLMFASVPLNLIRIKQPIIPEKTPISFPKFFNIAPLALVTAFIGGMAMNGFLTMGSLFVLLQGFDEKAVSYFIGSALIGGFVAQSFIGIISDKLGRKFAIMMSAIMALVSLILFVILKPSLYIQCVLAMFLGMSIFCFYVLALARANDMINDKSKSVEIGRTVLCAYSFGSLVAPLMLGIVMQIFDALGFVYFYIVIISFLIIFAINKPSIKAKFKFNQIKKYGFK